VDYVKSEKDYNKEAFEGDRNTAVDGVMNNLRNLKIYSQLTTYDKVRELDETETNALKVAVVMTVTSLILILAISVLITINITRPLSAIKKKTRRIARGDFGGQLRLSSPPEIKELEQSFNAMCIRLQALDTMKTDFFALMSHELRTPLASIKEATNLLMESLHGENITERQQKLFAIMKEENNRLIKLVNSLLDLSKMEAGMMVYAFNRSDLIALIKRAAREIEPLAEAKNIGITIEADQELPLIRADNERILQVLRNLIGNAVKFTPKDGQVHVFAKVVEQGVKVSVADTGVGIAKESLMTIFDKFQQEEVLTHFHKIKGTGLGLSLVKHIVKAHGGRIWAESTLGQGSTFSFVLPA
jgi:two-component system sensor histidine kinase GlrK